MHLSSLAAAAFLSLTPLAHSLAIAHRNEASHAITPRDEDYLDEGVYLTECARWQEGQATPNGYKDYLFLTANVDNAGDAIIARDFPYDHGLSGPGAHINWTVGTESQPISGTLNGRDFTAWDLKSTGDPNTGITGYAHMGGPMRCYRVRKTMTQQLMETPKVWYDCETMYMCTRAERKIRKTDFNVRNSTVEVTIAVTVDADSPDIPVEVGESVKEAFGRLNELYNADVAKNEASYKIARSDSVIQFAYDLSMTKDDAYFDKNRVPDIGDKLVSKLADEVTNTATVDKCKQNWGSQYPTCYYKVQFPSRIDIKVKVTEQAVENWLPQDVVGVAVKNIAVENDKCKTDGALAKAFSGVFGVASFIASGGLSAAATGLGAVLGTLGAAACGEIELRLLE